MKEKILLVGLLCLFISCAVVAKQKKSTNQVLSTEQAPMSTEQTLNNDEPQEEKPKMCYTHIKKWHPCPVQPKKKNKKEKSQ